MHEPRVTTTTRYEYVITPPATMIDVAQANQQALKDLRSLNVMPGQERVKVGAKDDGSIAVWFEVTTDGPAATSDTDVDTRQRVALANALGVYENTQFDHMLDILRARQHDMQNRFPPCTRRHADELLDEIHEAIGLTERLDWDQLLQLLADSFDPKATTVLPTDERIVALLPRDWPTWIDQRISMFNNTETTRAMIKSLLDEWVLAALSTEESDAT